MPAHTRCGPPMKEAWAEWLETLNEPLCSRSRSPSGTLSPSIGPERRQIARAALQTCSPLERPDRTPLGQALRSPPEPLVLTQQRHVPAARDPALGLPLGTGVEIAQPHSRFDPTDFGASHAARSGRSNRKPDPPLRAGPGRLLRLHLDNGRFQPRPHMQHVGVYAVAVLPRAAVASAEDSCQDRGV